MSVVALVADVESACTFGLAADCPRVSERRVLVELVRRTRGWYRSASVSGSQRDVGGWSTGWALLYAALLGGEGGAATGAVRDVGASMEAVRHHGFDRRRVLGGCSWERALQQTLNRRAWIGGSRALGGSPSVRWARAASCDESVGVGPSVAGMAYAVSVGPADAMAERTSRGTERSDGATFAEASGSDLPGASESAVSSWTMWERAQRHLC